MPTLICDMDGTLNQCDVYYQEVLEQAVANTVRHAPELPPVAIRELMDRCNLLSVAQPNAWHRHRFPSAVAGAAAAACHITGRPLTAERAAVEAYDIADRVFAAEYELYPEVWRVLEAAKEMGWRLLIFTKGDVAVQRRKLRVNELDQLAEWAITSAKDEARWQAFLEDKQVERSEPLVIVGDSLKDDIAPAKALGAYAVWADYGDHSWTYNQAPVIPDARITTFSGILPILAERGAALART